MVPGLLLGAATTWLRPFGWTLLGGLGVTLGLWLLCTALRQVLPVVAAIASVTAKGAIVSPLFYLLLALGAAALVAFPFVPYNTFGEDVKVIKDEGVTLIMVLGIILALWTASVSIAEELEERTALTLLSKPVRRGSFLVGKFLGILLPVAILFVILGVLFLGSIGYKVVYDAREISQPEPTSQQCAAEMKQVIPGVILAFMETVVLASISVAISTRLPMVPNLVICFAVYVLGHLVPAILNSAASQIEIVAFVARFFATLLPVLDNFSAEGAIFSGQPVPWGYLGWALGYCLLYSTAAMLLALLLYEDRDLA